MDDGYWEALLQEVEENADEQWNRRARGQGSSAVPRQRGGAGEQRNFPATLLPRFSAPLLSGPAVVDLADEADWARAQELLDGGELVAIKITGYNRGGLLADFGHIQGFLPSSHLLNPPASTQLEVRMATLAARVGETLAVRVIEIDRERRRLILSERCARENGRADALLLALQPGQMCRGRVTNLCSFGAFVDLGGFEGLIHISELSWGRVGTPDEVIKPGDEIEALVLEVNPPEQKVSLSLKRLRPDPWSGVESRYRPGQTVEAVITNVVNFGAFARLEEGLEGLIHVSELAEGSFMHPRNVIREGDQVRARVLGVDSTRRRIALTLRSAPHEPCPL
jgi:small subunit ribosomal protein S1